MTYDPATFINYYEDGQIKSESTRVNGLCQGELRVWYRDGKLKASIPFKDNLAHGIEKCWGKNGSLKSEKSFEMGIPHGIHKWYKYNKVSETKYFWHGVEVVFDPQHASLMADFLENYNADHPSAAQAKVLNRKLD
ncbi:hypothetical protein PEC18_04780 [Paucibacter sp. O1-1]|nr:hypothetical protein [Paucibacter sp. O1-1]MDA3825186.1 hypothetical protein [Paucibacter sp. O1-1]